MCKEPSRFKTQFANLPAPEEGVPKGSKQPSARRDMTTIELTLRQTSWVRFLSMPSLDPWHADIAECLRKGWLELHGFPATKWVEMAEELREEAHPEAIHVPARFVTGLVLIESQIRVDRRFTDIKSPMIGTAGIS